MWWCIFAIYPFGALAIYIYSSRSPISLSLGTQSNSSFPFRHIYILHFLSVMNSVPPLITPTSPPVCIVSLPPPLSLYSTSLSPSNHAILVLGGTSSLPSSSARLVRISANARPLFAFNVFNVCKQVVTSFVVKRVSRICFISAGCGAAIHS